MPESADLTLDMYTNKYYTVDRKYTNEYE